MRPLLQMLHPKLTSERLEVIKKYISTHRETEKKHLEIINKLVAKEHRTKLIPLWNVMGKNLLLSY